MSLYKYSLKLVVSLLLTVFVINNISPLISLADEQLPFGINDYEGASTNNSRVVVSMGDSYSSGEGVDPMYGRRDPADPNFMDWLAHRSQNSWSGQLVLPEVGELRAYKYPDCIDPQWYFVAASGATTYDIEGKQKKSYIRSDGTYVKDIELPAQTDVLDTVRDRGIVPEYITLTLGGNDLGFDKIVTEAAMHMTFTNPAGLADMLNDATIQLDTGEGNSPSLKERLKSTYEIIDEKSTIDGTHPCILVAGYPHLFNEDIYNVASTWGDEASAAYIFDLEEAAMINERIDYFDNAIESVVNECRESHKGMNIEYIEIRDIFSGHEVNTKDAWINPVIISHDQDLIHKVVTQKEISQDLNTTDNAEFHVPISAYSIHPNYKGATYGYRQCFQERIDYLEDLSSTPALGYSQMDFRIGSTVILGNYEGEELEWIVLDNNENGVFLVTKYAVEASTLNDDEYTGSITWETCTTRNWLNEEFYNNVFTSDEKAIIQVTHVVTPDNPAFGTPGGNDTDDRIFLLSEEEANQYFATFDSRRALPSRRAVNNEVIIDDNGEYCDWWLRSPGKTDGVSIAFVNGYGAVVEVGECASTEVYGIRPAMWLNADVNASASIQQDNSSVQIGNTVTFGEYRQDADGKVRPVEWIVLDIKDGKALIISKYVLDSIRYNFDSDPTTWENCYLRSWLNNQFLYSAFSGAERAMIFDTTLDNDDSPIPQDFVSNDTNDKVFVLSLSECEKYFNMTNDTLRYYGNDVCSCVPTEYALSYGLSLNTSGFCQWWTRTSGRSNNNVMYVDGDGSISIVGDAVGRIRRGVRPAMWVDLEGLAAENSVDEASLDETVTMIRDGNLVTFGHYEQDGDLTNGKEPVEWEVLSEEDGRMLLISLHVLDSQPYDATGGSTTWENCSLRRWLNDNFYNTAFNDPEKDMILSTTLSNPDNALYGIDGGNDTEDKVFCLSVEEVIQYYDPEFMYLVGTGYYSPWFVREVTPYAIEQGAPYRLITDELYSESIMIRYYSADVIGMDSGLWWLRSPGRFADSACLSYGLGNVGWDSSAYVDGVIGIRPALWLITDNTKGDENTTKTGIRVFDSPASTSGEAYGYEYEFKIPMVTIPGVDTDDANEEIEDEIIKYMSGSNKDEFSSEYFYFISDKIVSIIVYNDYIDFDDDWYTTIFNIEIETGRLIEDDEVVELYGMTDGEFFAKVENLYDDFNEDQLKTHPGFNDRSFFEQNFDRISYGNIDPFIGEDGHLCFAGYVNYIGGGGGAPYLFDLNKKDWHF